MLEIGQAEYLRAGKLVFQCITDRRQFIYVPYTYVFETDEFAQVWLSGKKKSTSFLVSAKLDRTNHSIIILLTVKQFQWFHTNMLDCNMSDGLFTKSMYR